MIMPTASAVTAWGSPGTSATTRPVAPSPSYGQRAGEGRVARCASAAEGRGRSPVLRIESPSATRRSREHRPAGPGQRRRGLGLLRYRCTRPRRFVNVPSSSAMFGDGQALRQRPTGPHRQRRSHHDDGHRPHRATALATAARDDTRGRRGIRRGQIGSSATSSTSPAVNRSGIERRHRSGGKPISSAPLHVRGAVRAHGEVGDWPARGVFGSLPNLGEHPGGSPAPHRSSTRPQRDRVPRSGARATRGQGHGARCESARRRIDRELPVDRNERVLPADHRLGRPIAPVEPPIVEAPLVAHEVLIDVCVWPGTQAGDHVVARLDHDVAPLRAATTGKPTRPDPCPTSAPCSENPSTKAAPTGQSSTTLPAQGCVNRS